MTEGLREAERARPVDQFAPEFSCDLVDGPQAGQPLVGAAGPGAGHRQGARAIR